MDEQKLYERIAELEAENRSLKAKVKKEPINKPVIPKKIADKYPMFSQVGTLRHLSTVIRHECFRRPLKTYKCKDGITREYKETIKGTDMTDEEYERFTILFELFLESLLLNKYEGD